MLHGEQCFVFAFGPEENVLTSQPDMNTAGQLVTLDMDTVAGDAVAQRQPYNLCQSSEHVHFHAHDRVLGCVTQCTLVIPLYAKNAVVGVVQVWVPPLCCVVLCCVVLCCVVLCCVVLCCVVLCCVVLCCVVLCCVVLCCVVLCCVALRCVVLCCVVLCCVVLCCVVLYCVVLCCVVLCCVVLCCVVLCCVALHGIAWRGLVWRGRTKTTPDPSPPLQGSGSAYD